MNIDIPKFKPDPKDCFDVILDDIQLHTQKKRKPNSLGKQVAKAVHGSKTNRSYSNSITTDEKTKTVSLTMNLGMEHLYDLARKQGKKYIRFFVKKDGMPVALGNDAVEKLLADSKKYLKK